MKLWKEVLGQKCALKYLKTNTSVRALKSIFGSMLKWLILSILLAAYAVGMILTFVVLVLMKKGQPALLYLVPCTLITASVVAWRRKEMKRFWKGSSYQVCAYILVTKLWHNSLTDFGWELPICIKVFMCQKITLDLSECPQFFPLLPPCHLLHRHFSSSLQSDAKILVTQIKLPRSSGRASEKTKTAFKIHT